MPVPGGGARLIHLSYKLTAYVPTARWEAVAGLLPDAYTITYGDGVWGGEEEMCRVVTVLGHSPDLYALGDAISRALIRAGESAALMEYTPTNGWLMTKEEVAPDGATSGAENRATA